MLGLKYGTCNVVSTMVSQCLRSTGGKLILARSRMITSFEVMGGMRVSETTGDEHGVAANDVCILTSMTGMHADLGPTIEVWVPDSKTGPGRFVNFVGTSFVSRVPSERFVRDIWRAYGLRTYTAIDGGFSVERADYGVARVSLLGMTEADVARFRAALTKQKDGLIPVVTSVAQNARISIGYLDRLVLAKDVDESRKYVNIAGGPARGPELTLAMEWLAANGLSKWSSRAQGPFLRSTESGSGALTHMPLQVGSTYTHHVGSMRSAYALSASMEEPDLELDLQGQETPVFANHSARRHADRVARETLDKTLCTLMDIDVVFGWNEAKRRKDMQTHYQGLDRVQRVRLARVTMYM